VEEESLYRDVPPLHGVGGDMGLQALSWPRCDSVGRGGEGPRGPL